jgi:hypothetical protein
MRTKSLVLAAVLSAAGVASSLAQVYSVNVVGYINLPLSPGLNLITAQLKGTNQNVNTLLGSATPTMPDNSLLFTWNPTAQRYDNALIGGGGVWYDGAGNPSTTTLSPGQAFFIQVAGTVNVSLTLVGEVPTGPNAVSVVNGLGFYGDPAPVSQNIATNGFPVADNDSLYTWNTAGQRWNNALIGVGPGSGGPAWFDGGGNPVVFAPAVGQGFAVLHSGGAATWNRNFTVQ